MPRKKPGPTEAPKRAQWYFRRLFEFFGEGLLLEKHQELFPPKEALRVGILINVATKDFVTQWIEKLNSHDLEKIRKTEDGLGWFRQWLEDGDPEYDVRWGTSTWPQEWAQTYARAFLGTQPVNPKLTWREASTQYCDLLFSKTDEGREMIRPIVIPIIFRELVKLGHADFLIKNERISYTEMMGFLSDSS